MFIKLILKIVILIGCIINVIAWGEYFNNIEFLKIIFLILGLIVFVLIIVDLIKILIEIIERIYIFKKKYGAKAKDKALTLTNTLKENLNNSITRAKECYTCNEFKEVKDELKQNKANKNEEYNGLIIKTDKLIVYLLIIIIIILLWSNGVFFKFTIITENNINKVLSSRYLSTEEKQSLTMQIVFNKSNVYGKMVWELI